MKFEPERSREPQIAMTLKVSAPEYWHIKQIALDQRMSGQALLRQAVRELIERHKGTPASTWST